MLLVSEGSTVEVRSYHDQAKLLLKQYLLPDSLIPYTSVIGGIIACKMVYDITHLISAIYFKSYASLSRHQRVEWCNRAISTVHAIFITIMSLYFVFWSNLYTDTRFAGLITSRRSPLSTFALGVSVGYFIADMSMIIWFYPALGGKEYLLHHVISLASVAYAMLTGEGQLYTYMVLISETTTPGINLRWYLDTAGTKRSRSSVVNGVVIFFAWLVARVLLFFFIFYHVYLHSEQVKRMHAFGQLLVIVVPAILAVMNLLWFWKIIRGLKKTLTKTE